MEEQMAMDLGGARIRLACTNVFAIAALTGIFLGGCTVEGVNPGDTVKHLDPTLVWVDDNRTRLDDMMDSLGKSSQGYNAEKPPVAIFDWDNTVIKNDIGDATMFWMLKNDKILQPPGKNWRRTSPLLTMEAATALSTACDALAADGAPLPTKTDTACADEIVSVYYDGATTAGADAFGGFNYRTMEPGYAWAAQLQAGYSPDEIRSFAQGAIDENLAAMEGATQTVGSRADLNGYIRIYDQIKDLIGALQENGFDVWVVSASSQLIVEPFASRVGIQADHVIGIRIVPGTDSRTTYDIQGCGSVPDGTNDGQGAVTGNSLITYIEGKRCWVNRVIFGDMGPTAMDRATDPAKRPAFGAGDSDTDVAFLQDASNLRLALNRNKKEIMCNAYANLGGTWLVNPMFISPKAKLDTGYACSTDACKDATGAAGPCLNEEGAIIADQQDTVFCASGVYCE
jgi:hypothetical protein